jgi:hypothetical protein
MRQRRLDIPAWGVVYFTLGWTVSGIVWMCVSLLKYGGLIPYDYGR